ncbi:MAG: glycosyltransferase [Planctomycetes bacterium]|jgi:cellulose synthase/poly-beta-1,6-N-acetylglucosamine synthase-like glycosyltransferase|nr:glycosyltransferase [Planctomycetota bacterium]
MPAGLRADTFDWLAPLLTTAYLLVLALIGAYGLHRYWLVYLFARHRRRHQRLRQRFDPLPTVTVQLPMYNEGSVAARIIDAACAIDYPRDRFQVQVVDDSTDDSARIARQRVEHWRARGIDIRYHHRTDRVGFKAGALAEATKHATGQFIAIFDADFIPPANFLKRTIHHFADPQVGMVQTRWAHLNRDDSLLTRGQAIFLDGHFIIEHTARHRSGAWINFNGTAGLWRRETIDAAGGWQHDTLTEDVDLSYRAQLLGWKFVFLPRVTCPAELPPEINAFKSQQHRWTKGSIQTALKLLPTVLRAKVPLMVKAEAFFHLTSPMVYLYITLFALLFYPAIFVNIQPVGRGSWLGLAIGLSMFALGTISATAFYITSQRAQGRSGLKALLQVPLLMAIGVGIALNNAAACLEALFGHQSDFVRTPKYGLDVTRKTRSRLAAVAHIPSLRKSISLLEIGMGFYMIECIRLSLVYEQTIIGLPFLCLFAAGYLYVGVSSLRLHLRVRRQARRPAVTPTS